MTEVHAAPAPRTDVEHYDTLAYDPFEGRRLAAYRLTQMIYWVFAPDRGPDRDSTDPEGARRQPDGGLRPVHLRHHRAAGRAFAGLFGNPAYQNSVLELSSIVALVVYALVAWLLGKLVWILMGENRSAMRTHSTQMDSRV